MADPDRSVDDAPPPPQPPKPGDPGTTAAARARPPKPAQPDRSASGASETSNNSNSTTTDNEAGWTARNSFTADSPYFTAFCDNEVKQLHVLSDSLREIASRTQTLTKTGMIMSEASQRLAASCKFQSTNIAVPEDETPEQKEERLAAMRHNRQIRKQAVGEEMASFLEILGDVSLPACCACFCFYHYFVLLEYLFLR